MEIYLPCSKMLYLLSAWQGKLLLTQGMTGAGSPSAVKETMQTKRLKLELYRSRTRPGFWFYASGWVGFYFFYGLVSFTERGLPTTLRPSGTLYWDPLNHQSLLFFFLMGKGRTSARGWSLSGSWVLGRPFFAYKSRSLKVFKGSTDFLACWLM